MGVKLAIGFQYTEQYQSLAESDNSFDNIAKLF